MDWLKDVMDVVFKHLPKYLRVFVPTILVATSILLFCPWVVQLLLIDQWVKKHQEWISVSFLLVATICIVYLLWLVLACTKRIGNIITMDREMLEYVVRYSAGRKMTAYNEHSGMLTHLCRLDLALSKDKEPIRTWDDGKRKQIAPKGFFQISLRGGVKTLIIIWARIRRIGGKQ